jgi:hypothetical protein
MFMAGLTNVSLFRQPGQLCSQKSQPGGISMDKQLITVLGQLKSPKRFLGVFLSVFIRVHPWL